MNPVFLQAVFGQIINDHLYLFPPFPKTVVWKSQENIHHFEPTHIVPNIMPKSLSWYRLLNLILN